MLQHPPPIHRLLKSVVCLVFLAGFGFLNLAEVMAQPAPKPPAVLDLCTCTKCENTDIPAIGNMLQAIVTKRLGIVINKDEDLSERINSLKIISLVATKKEYKSAYGQRTEIVQELKNILNACCEEPELKNEIVKQLPLILTYPLQEKQDKSTTVDVTVTVERELNGELKGKLKGELKDELKSKLTGELNGKLNNGLKGKLKIPEIGDGEIEGSAAPSIVAHQDDYQDLIDLMNQYLNASPISFDKSWQVTSALRSGLLGLPIARVGIEPHHRCGYCDMTSALNKIALNSRLDTQVRFNAMNALVEKGDRFRGLKKEGKPEEGKVFAKSDDLRYFCFIIVRLNEILLDKNTKKKDAKKLPVCIRDKANYDLIRFLKYDLSEKSDD
ncbi:hypothetical protein [Gimesia algae]|uniref:Uncharacterized protein n=1 Tax=Gimesia algae TaxID=2527971 RepID=A0A517VHA0_9PLAN|nr:hypothetical protein [Gimesia algae]QDT92337.1 hypothetical protein Pan161_40040 [Gimesia algae]